jgi:hypothetical protein
VFQERTDKKMHTYGEIIYQCGNCGKKHKVKHDDVLAIVHILTSDDDNKRKLLKAIGVDTHKGHECDAHTVGISKIIGIVRSK